MMQETEQIHITTGTARWLLETCVNLVKHYLGRDFDPSLGTFTDRNREVSAIEDRIPVDDYELRHWSNAVINLATTIAGILHHALTANQLLRMRNILPLLGDNGDVDENIGREI